MKIYRTTTGCWVNLNLCPRFYVKRKAGEFGVEAAIDISDEEEIIINLEGPYRTLDEAQFILDRIMGEKNDRPNLD